MFLCSLTSHSDVVLVISILRNLFALLLLFIFLFYCLYTNAVNKLSLNVSKTSYILFGKLNAQLG